MKDITNTVAKLREIPKPWALLDQWDPWTYKFREFKIRVYMEIKLGGIRRNFPKYES